VHFVYKIKNILIYFKLWIKIYIQMGLFSFLKYTFIIFAANLAASCAHRLRITAVDACHSVKGLLSSRLLSRLQILFPVGWCDCPTWSLALRREHKSRLWSNDDDVYTFHNAKGYCGPNVHLGWGIHELHTDFWWVNLSKSGHLDNMGW
jgi:hypothetical protein